MTQDIVQNVVEGKFGFYPCNKEVYSKLKRLNMLNTEHVRVDKRHQRWANKAPQNRFAKKWNRNDKGQKISFEVGHPILEPREGCAEFKKEFREKGKAYWFPKISSIIENDYRNARYPQQKAEDVKPLKLPEAEIDRLLLIAEEWFKIV